MTCRRQFIQSGLALSTVSVLPPTLNVALASQEMHKQLFDCFIIDSRYPKSIAADESPGQLRMPVMQIHGDVTALWIDHFSRQWKAAPMYLAGLTGKDALFVLETLAWDYGMRVSHRHLVDATGPQHGGVDVPLYYWVIAPKSVARNLCLADQV